MKLEAVSAGGRSLVVRALDLKFRGAEFKSRPDGFKLDLDTVVPSSNLRTFL